MKMYHSTYLFILYLSLLATYTYSFPSERFGTFYYTGNTQSMTPEQQNLMTKGILCSNIKLNTGITTFEEIVDSKDFSNGIIKSMIVTPIKHPSHSQFSPMTSYFSFAGHNYFEICTIDEGFNQSFESTEFIGANWMVNTGEIFGGQSKFATTTFSEVSISIPFDLDPNTDYVVFAGIAHHTVDHNPEDLMYHSDTIWLRVIDYSTGVIRISWTDSPEGRIDHKNGWEATVSVVAIPTNNIPSGGPTLNKDYEVGKAEFTWPENTYASGICIDIPFEHTFPFPPYVFATTEYDFNSETLAVTTWVEYVNEIGCRICTSLMPWALNNQNSRMQKESGLMKFHYLAFTKSYTESQMESFTNPLHIQATALFATIPSNADEAFQKQFLIDCFSLYSDADSSLKNADIKPTHLLFPGVSTAQFYYDTNISSFQTMSTFKNYIDRTKITHSDHFKFDPDSPSHRAFQEKYVTILSNTSDPPIYQNITINIEFGRFPSYSTTKVNSDCTATTCSQEGGTMSLTKTLLNYGYADTTYGQNIYWEQHCNGAPCISKIKKYDLVEADNKSFILKEQNISSESGRSSSPTIIIIIVVFIVAILAIAVLFYYFRKPKRRSYLKMKRASTPSQVAN